MRLIKKLKPMNTNERRESFRAHFRARLAEMSDDKLLDILFRTHELRKPPLDISELLKQQEDYKLSSPTEESNVHQNKEVAPKEATFLISLNHKLSFGCRK